MRPGRAVAVPVVANDSDPEGDDDPLVKDGAHPAGRRRALGARSRATGSSCTAPDEEVRDVAAVHDPRRARREGHAVLQVTVAEDVPLHAPDRPRRPGAAPDVEEGSRRDLEVLANDEDPDGTVDDLDVEVGGGATRARGRHGADHARPTSAADPLHDHRPRRARRHPPSSTSPRSTACADPDLDRAHRGATAARRSRSRSPITCARRRRRRGRHHRGGEGQRGALRRRGPRQGPDDAGLHVGARLLRAGRDHVRGHRRHRPRRPRGPQGDAHASRSRCCRPRTSSRSSSAARWTSHPARTCDEPRPRRAHDRSRSRRRGRMRYSIVGGAPAGLSASIDGRRSR